MEVVRLLGWQGFWQHQVLRGLAAEAAGNMGVLEGNGNQHWPSHPCILARKTLLPDREAWQASPQGCRVGHGGSNPARTDKMICLWRLCPRES